MPASRYLAGPIAWYSFLIVAGAALAIFLAHREAKRIGLPQDTILDLALWLLPMGIIGARIYYVAFSWAEFADHPLSVLYIWEGGIAIYGAILAGLITVILFCRRRRLPVLLLCDLIAPGLVLAQAIGRWGNYFNMEAYGPAIQDPRLQFFPLAVLIPEAGENVWHLATFFLESAWDFAIFHFLLFARRRWLRRQGDVFFFYAFLYAAGRLVIEDFRTDSLYSGGIRVSQLLSLAVMIGLLIFYLVTGKSRPRKSALPGQLLIGCALVLSLPVLGYTLGLPFLRPEGLRDRCLLLCGFSLLAILALFFHYGHSDPSEVIYACDKV